MADIRQNVIVVGPSESYTVLENAEACSQLVVGSAAETAEITAPDSTTIWEVIIPATGHIDTYNEIMLAPGCVITNNASGNLYIYTE